MGLLRGFMGGLWRCGALEIELSTELREIMEGPFALVECPCLLSTVFSRFLSVKALEKIYAVPHLHCNAHPIYLNSCHSILRYKLLEAHFTVSGTNQRRPYK